MPRRKTLLFVTDVFPFPLDRGNHIRIFNLLCACAGACDVTLIAPAPASESEGAPVEILCKRVIYLAAEPLPLSKEILRVVRTLRIAPGLPWPATIRRYAAYVGPLREAQPHSFDLIWAERPHIARLCFGFSSRTIVDLDDIEHVKIGRLLALARGFHTKVQDLYRYYYYRYIEISRSRQFRAIVVCSDQDRQYLMEKGCKNVVVVPNAPNVKYVEYVSPIRRGLSNRPLRMVFLGNVESPPNADAIDFIIERILPELCKYIPDATVDVIGPGSMSNDRYRRDSRITFRGFVDDLNVALSQYHLLIAPLRFGSGTKLKVLDAMLHGIPVITTQVGAEGLALIHGENVWLAETVPQIVDGIRKIYADPDLGERLAINAQTHVRSRYSWPVIQDQVVRWLRQLD